ncbi:IS3 family transposase [Streptomyces sp. NPDC088254]|uniref:IS3 family transposase n=1 Tax=Streptomyces sp. NPDC088254 TaxID=3365847 RepID=UPI0038041CD1
MNDVYAFIEAEKTAHPVALLCRLLKVARSSFYAWMAGEQARAARRAADDALAHEITVLHIASRCTYGVPRVHAELRRLDRRVNRKRVERIMRERDIAGVTRRKRRSLTRPAKKAVAAHDLIGRDFTADAPGRKLVGCITCIPTDEGWLYLATWLDLAAREIVGYSMADHYRASLVVDALAMAAGRSDLQPGCIVHSDRGAEYTADELRWEVRRLGLRQSMGRTGSCYDNAAAESFFALLKAETGTPRWPDRTTARAEILTFIETFCNRKRLRRHPVWGHPTPLEAATRARTRPRSVSIECPASRGNFTCHVPRVSGLAGLVGAGAAGGRRAAAAGTRPHRRDPHARLLERGRRPRASGRPQQAPVRPHGGLGRRGAGGVVVADTPPEPPRSRWSSRTDRSSLGQGVWREAEFDDSVQLSAGVVDDIRHNRCGAIAESSDGTLPQGDLCPSGSGQAEVRGSRRSKCDGCSSVGTL